MGAFGNLISGVGQGAGNLGAQLREQQFTHNENALRLWHQRAKDLADRIKTSAATYGDPENSRLLALEAEIASQQPGTDLAPFWTKYNQHVTAAQKAQEQRAIQDARTIKPVAPAEPPTAMNSSPFAPFIAQPQNPALAPAPPVPLLRPSAPLAAQVPTSPVAPGAQGGGLGPNAGFPAPSASAAPAPVQPVPSSAPAVGRAAPGGPEAAGNHPVLVPPITGGMNLQPSIDSFNETQHMDPLALAMAPGQIGLGLAQQKLQMVEPYLKQIEAESPQLASMIRAEILAGGSGGLSMSAMLGAFTGQPVAGQIPLSAFQAAHPGFLEAHYPADYLASLDPNTPVRYQENKLTHQPVLAEIQSQTLHFGQNDQGQITGVGSRTGTGTVSTGQVAPSQNTPIRGIGPNGDLAISSAAGAKSGEKPVDTGMIPPSMLGSQQTPQGGSVKTVPRGGGGGAGAARVPGPPGAPAPTGATPVPPTSPLSPAVPVVLPKFEPTIRPFDPKNRVDRIARQMAVNVNAGEKEITNAADKYQVTQRMAELGLNPGMVTSSMMERAKNARLILGHMVELNQIIDQAEKDGDLGVVASRWNSWLTNKLGVDPTKSQVFAKLSGMQGFLSTAVSMAHGGLRGGSSPTMVEHWETALDAKDPATLRAKLVQAKHWMEGYAQLDNGLADTPISGVPGSFDPNAARSKYKY